jgi:uncharacterized protein (DUF433 family)
MAQVARTQPAPRIVRNPRICGGEPTVDGTRVPVSAIVVQWRFYQDVEQVRQAFPHLYTRAIETALRYYEKHRAEIDRLIEEQEQAASTAD